MDINSNIQVHYQDNLQFLKSLPDKCINLCYIDPPFNTKKTQKRTNYKMVPDENGSVGFGGIKYKREAIVSTQYSDTFDDFIGFLRPRIEETYRILKDDGCIYLHLDWREVHYAKIMMDEIFGRDNFMSEIIWSYDYGAKSKCNWAAKHDNILYYTKDKKHYTFNYDKVPRIPYLAPDLAGPEKAARGKAVTNVWTETIVPTNSKEKCNYSTQKPLRILRRIVDVSSNPGDLCIDFFAGSGSFGAACKELGRNCILVDQNPEAIKVMMKRFNLTDIAKP